MPLLESDFSSESSKQLLITLTPFFDQLLATNDGLDRLFTPIAAAGVAMEIVDAVNVAFVTAAKPAEVAVASQVMLYLLGVFVVPL